MKDIILSVKNLSVKAGLRYLIEEISFDVHASEIVAIIGPNGAGKTTLVKAILDLIPKTSGSVDLYTKAGYVPQKFDFDRTFPLTVKDFLGLTAEKSQKLSEKLLQEVDAVELFHEKLGILSGGEFQRIMIAYALSGNPGILFLDEPVTGIDIEGEEIFYNLLKKLSYDKNVAIVLVSHDLNVVYEYADQVICLNRKMMCQGKPFKVLTPDNIAQTFGGHKSVYKHH